MASSALGVPGLAALRTILQSVVGKCELPTADERTLVAPV
jgi:hypothetical protein